MSTPHLLAAFGIRWHAMPPAWVLGLVIVPAAILVGWWAYQRDRDVPTRGRILLGLLRATALVFLLLVWYRALSILTDLEYWAVAARLYDVRQAKRLFALVYLGTMSAIAVGGLAVATLVALIGTTIWR